MNKWWFPAVTALALLGGCATEQPGSIPVVDSGSAVSNAERVTNNGGYRAAVVTQRAAPQAMPADSGVVVMVPGHGAVTSSAPIQNYPSSGPVTNSITTGALPSSSAPINSTVQNQLPAAQANLAPAQAAGSSWTPAAKAAPSGIPSAGGLSADEQLDGPVLALLTTAQQQQSSGDLNGASSSLERAQRIAPGEPQVLYRLAQVRLAQGDGAQAEQLARRGLSYANGRPALQASLWGLIAQARDKQGDSAGAAQARLRAKATS